MKRLFLAILLTAGMIAGYGSAFSSWDGKAPCHRREPPPPTEP